MEHQLLGWVWSYGSWLIGATSFVTLKYAGSRRSRRRRWGWFAAGLNQALLWVGYGWLTGQRGLVFWPLVLAVGYFSNYLGWELPGLAEFSAWTRRRCYDGGRDAGHDRPRAA